MTAARNALDVPTTLTDTPPADAPPAPIWRDEASYLTVWVNGGLIEINMGDGWSGRLLPDEVAALPAEFARAIEEARAWAARWDVYTGTYRPAIVELVACVVCTSTDCVVPFLNTHVCASCFNTATLGDVRDAAEAR
ncbi:uncharacterized protein RMCC_1337 [Mycolicibacterium canariasense]|uniref:Uncharacterized protein n=1 Tax=Mycolicibacterium canariasense TaxID=228230 RepID=A0A100WA51_MYCCR|nr:hypothetical protein [Mycolicibacterium canariasense]MCV7208840.1 hypothetical protein [Mycolicibacterium canariasense]ORV07097.1 hypothetical protein AWB94_13930 [Mycolicibacterium canariasense]GAS94371.1 uncharacterized protein RMCC_1337 [Mycolicibacterium canariasense]